MFWGELHDEAMRKKTAGAGRMAAGNSCDLFSAGLIRVPVDQYAQFKAYLLERGRLAKLVDNMLTGNEFLDLHLDPVRANLGSVSLHRCAYGDLATRAVVRADERRDW